MTVCEYLDARRIVSLGESRLEVLMKNGGPRDQIDAVRTILREAREDFLRLIHNATSAERRLVSVELADAKCAAAQFYSCTDFRSPVENDCITQMKCG